MKTSKQRETKYNSIALFILLFVGLHANGQSSRDSIVKVDSYSKYLGLTCTFREKLIKSVEQQDSFSVNSLRKIISVYQPCEDCQVMKSPLTTIREDVLLNFFTQSYDKLLAGINEEVDYFSLINRKEKIYQDPNFECGNLTLGLLDFWKAQSSTIVSEIEKSKLSNEEQGILIFYWQSILLYIEAGEDLPSTISEDASNFLQNYPDSQDRDFVNRLQSMKKVYHPNGMSLGFGLGKPILVGNIKNYLKGDFAFQFEVGWTYRGWNLTLGYRELTFNYSDTLQLNRIDDLVIKESSTIGYNGAALKIGYTVLDKNWYRVQPFVTAEVNKFVNYIDIPDSTGISEKGNAHAAFSFGTEMGVRIVKNVIGSDVKFIYYPREEKDSPYNPLFLNFRLGYYPAIFNKPTGISGGSLYWTFGLEWLIGTRQAHYRSRK